MKNSILLLLICFITFKAKAQEKSLISSVNSQVVNKAGIVKYVKFNDNVKFNTENETTILKQFLKISEGITFTKIDSKSDNLGMTHHKFQQYYKGIPVEFGIFKIHQKKELLTSINGDFFPVEKNINITASFSAMEAIAKAKQHINAVAYYETSENSTPTLVIFPKIEGINSTNRLAYKFDIYAEKPIYRADIYVDAQTGEIIFENNKIHKIDVPATGTTQYNGTQNFTAEQTGNSYRLRQTTNGNGIQTFDAANGLGFTNAVDITNTTTNFMSNPTAVQVHWSTEQAYDYYLQVHGRDSYDGNGAILKSYINYGNSSIANAFWDGDNLAYNSGNGTDITDMVSLDIVGHEMSHGVIQHSANLIYSYQPGAINESFADIFGEMIEKHAQNTNDWLLGADVHVNANQAFRSMSDPKSRNQPDTYLGQYWHTSASDNFGVHINSGVQNKWFYLLSEGGNGTNDNNYTYNVSGIGMVKAAEIAYRNLTVYLTANSNFFDARAGAIQSAIDLYGAISLEVVATTEAWNAVGVGTTSTDTIPPTTPINLDSANVTQYIVDLSWDFSTDNINVVGYNIYQGTSVIGTSDVANYQVQDYMPLNTVYDFTVVAFDAAGNFSGVSNTESVWIDTLNPSNPINLSSNNTTVTTTNLSWDAATDNFSVAAYKIFQDNVLLTTVTNTSYYISGLTANTAYNYKILAVDSSGNESNFSNTETVNTLAPCTPGNVTLTIDLDFYPDETSWDIKDSNNTIIASGGNYLPTDASTTKIYSMSLGSGFYTLNMHDTFGDGFVSPGGYTFMSNVIIASGGFNSIAMTTTTTAFCVDGDAVLSNQNFTANDSVKIIAKPNFVEVVVKNNFQFKNYKLYSLTGAKVANGTTKQINTSALANSVYILKLELNKGIVTKKIIVNN